MLLAWGLSVFSWPLIVNRVIQYIGTVSYSCYLCHFFVVYVIMPHIAHALIRVAGRPINHYILFPLCYLAALALTVGLSALAYRFVEQPGIALGRRLIARNEARAEPLAAATA